MKKYIGIYGGTELTAELSGFVEDLSHAFLEHPDIVLVTGGFSSSDKQKKGTVSTDRSVLNGALRFTGGDETLLAAHFETWLPDRDKDRDAEGVERFARGHVITMTGKSAQARRLSLANNVNALITVKGKKQTALVLNLALAVDKPAFPLAFTGGDSLDYWIANKDQVKKWFGIDDVFAGQLETVRPGQLPATEKDLFVKKIVMAVLNGIQKRCLVLMSFDPEPSQFYDDVIKPAIIDMGYKPIRIDKEANEGNIFRVFQERLQDCDAILADITEANPNVMYELGYAHAQDFPAILFSRKKLDEISKSQIPFYLSMDSIEHSDAETDEERKRYLTGRIVAHLEKKKGKRAGM